MIKQRLFRTLLFVSVTLFAVCAFGQQQTQQRNHAALFPLETLGCTAKKDALDILRVFMTRGETSAEVLYSSLRAQHRCDLGRMAGEPLQEVDKILNVKKEATFYDAHIVETRVDTINELEENRTLFLIILYRSEERT